MPGLVRGVGPRGLLDLWRIGRDASTEDDSAGLDAAADGGTACVAGSDPSLVAYFPFDDGSGTKARDCSGNARDGTIVGAVASGRTWRSRSWRDGEVLARRSTVAVAVYATAA